MFKLGDRVTVRNIHRSDMAIPAMVIRVEGRWVTINNDDGTLHGWMFKPDGGYEYAAQGYYIERVDSDQDEQSNRH